MTNCILWEGTVTNSGYGRKWFQGKARYAHRVAYYLTHNEWPEVVRHTCDNKVCVNPEHLLGGTQKDNVADMYARKREGAHCATLNVDLPSQYEDRNAYRREAYRRQREGTWAYRKEFA